MRYAVIDTGSNTIRLGIYDYENGKLTQIYNSAVFANLAGYVENGVLSDQGIQVATRAILSLKQKAEEYACVPCVFATAAIRNAGNTEEICEKIFNKTNLKVDVLQGNEEASYSFYGAADDFPCNQGVMADVGGGSSEIIFFDKKNPVSLCSVPWGSLKSYRAFVRGALPDKTEILGIQSAIIKELNDNKAFQGIKENNLCIVGGGVEASVKLAKAFLREETLSVCVLEKMLSVIVENPEHAMSVIEKVAPKRALTIAPAIAIYTAVGTFFGADTVYVSDNGIKEGYILKSMIEKMV